VFLSALGCLFLFAEDDRNEGGELDSSVKVFEKYLGSSKSADRYLAISNISDYAYLASDRELGEFLARGLADEGAEVRFASAQAVAANARRVAEMDGNGRIEQLVQGIAYDVLRGKDVIEIEGMKTREAIAAMAALQNIKYNKLPYPRYCEWEDENLIRVIGSLSESADAVDRYGAAVLCDNIKCSENTSFKIGVLRKSLADASDQVRLMGLYDVASLENLSSLTPDDMVVYASLRADIELFRESGSSKLKEVAVSTIAALDSKLTDSAKKYGVRIVNERVDQP